MRKGQLLFAASGESSCRNYGHTHKKPPHSTHLQSTTKLSLGIIPVSTFVSNNGQAGNILQTNERKNLKN